MRINRRDFLKSTAGAAVSSALLSGEALAQNGSGMPMRALGKTGEHVSLLTVGGHHIARDPLTLQDSIRLQRMAIDEGVNFFDNAWVYHQGKSEEWMGQALKDGYRDKVFLMTKHLGREPKKAQEQLEDSLRRFDVDVIDLWQYHMVSKPGEVESIYDSGALDVALKARDQGKIRYIGFTGHASPSIHLDMIERGFAWDAVQMPVNVFDHHYKSFEQNVLPKAREKGIAVLGMKTAAGGRILESGAANVEECLRYAMSIPVTTVVSGMNTLEMLKENLAVAKGFQGMPDSEKSELLARTKAPAMTGRHEYYKV
jgi:predicted aldo/keto reductase-like oxidoreductase